MHERRADDEAIDGVLSGVRVADFSRVLAGPYATMMLADFGADVVKIEPPAGDDTRHWRPPVDATARPPTSAASTATSARRARPDGCRGLAGRAARGLGRRRHRELPPGRDGPLRALLRRGAGVEPGRRLLLDHGLRHGGGAALAGYDLLVQAVGGLMSITGAADGEPRRPASPSSTCSPGRTRSPASCSRSASATARAPASGSRSTSCRACSRRSRTRPRRRSPRAPAAAPRQRAPEHRALRRLPRGRPRARDRRRQRQAVPALAAVLGVPALAGDPRFAGNVDRVAHRAELTAAIEERLAAASAAHWVEALSAAGVPAGLVNDVAEAIAFGEALGLDPVAEIAPGPSTSRTIANPIGLSASPAAYRTPPPALDEHAGADWHQTPRKDRTDDHRPHDRRRVRPRRPAQRRGARVAAEGPRLRAGPRCCRSSRRISRRSTSVASS